MHFARTHKKLTAQFGLVAIVLMLFVPMMSRALELRGLRASGQAASPYEAKQSVFTNTDLPARHDMPADHHTACGCYDPLAERVLVPTIIPAMAAPTPTYATAWSPEPGRLAMRQACEAGRPRDSPFLF